MNEKLYELLDAVRRSAAQMGEAASDTAYAAGKKAEELVDKAKLRIRLATLEGSVDTCLMDVGGMIYATHTGNPAESDALLSKLEEIDGLKLQIAELEKLLGREPSRCPVCQGAVREGDAFCRECGSKL